jgi:hypothetical protein
MRLFPILFRQRLFHDANGTLHRRLRVAEHAAMSYGKHRWLERQQFARALLG